MKSLKDFGSDKVKTQDASRNDIENCLLFDEDDLPTMMVLEKCPQCLACQALPKSYLISAHLSIASTIRLAQESLHHVRTIP